MRSALAKYVLIGQTPVVEPDLEKWAEWIETSREARIVAQTDVRGGVMSTVFLGIDYQFGEGPPLLFETAIFVDGEGEVLKRCSTWAEAEAQHQRTLAEWQRHYREA